MLRAVSGQFLFFDLVSVLSGFPVTGFSGLISGRKATDGISGMIVLSGNIIELGGGMYRANLYDLFTLSWFETLALVKWLCYGVGGGHSFSNSHVSRSSVYAGFSTPFADGFRNSIYCCQYIVTFIRSLFRPSCPPAIIWFISIVIVNTVKRMLLGWWVSHILKEIVKVKPSSANFDPSFFVVFPLASFKHRAPRYINLTAGFSMR